MRRKPAMVFRPDASVTLLSLISTATGFNSRRADQSGATFRLCAVELAPLLRP